MLNFVLWLVFFCPHTDKHLAVLSKRTFDTQSIHIFGLVLEVEKGRHQNIPFVNCKLEIEDEIHLLLQCPILNSFRTEAMQQISDICKIFASLDNKSKFIWLLSNENIIIINIVIKLLMSLTEIKLELNCYLGVRFVLRALFQVHIVLLHPI
jgi:hypothetical protein